VLVACVSTACSEKTEQRAREAGQQAGEAAQAVGAAAKSAAQDAVNNTEGAVAAVKASKTTEEAREKVSEAEEAAAAAVQTAKVKGALVADSSVTSTGIDVDADAHTKTIMLKGHVPSTGQKTAAGRIATEKASTGYVVRNELMVRP